MRKATRGRESALQRKQEQVKSEGEKIIRNWVQELVRFYPSGERGYDILEVKSLKRITRYEEMFAECLELGRDSSVDDEQEVEVFPAEEEEEGEEEAEEDEEEP